MQTFLLHPHLILNGTNIIPYTHRTVWFYMEESDIEIMIH